MKLYLDFSPLWQNTLVFLAEASFLAGIICYNYVKNIPVEVDFKMKTSMKCLAQWITQVANVFKVHFK